MPDNPDQFSAVDSALGYLYQVRCALLWSLQRLKKEPIFDASIEILDDVAFESNGTVQELLQTKHHKNRGANLSDACTDLWKTLRIWIAAWDAGHISSTTVLYLVTTGNVVSGNTAGYLKTNGRDTDIALQRLLTTAQTSTNQTNKRAYEAFAAKSTGEQRSIIERIFVVDSAPDITDIDNLLKEELIHASKREHRDAFLEYLEGWWFRRAIEMLQKVDRDARISSQELEAKMADLRDQFRRGSLPIADDLLNYQLEDETAESHSDFPFVRQIKLATSHTTRVASAIQDYYRAFEQRSRWQRQDLLFVGDLSTYEKKLIEEWELQFSALEDRLAADPTEDDKKKTAKEILFWVENGNVKARIQQDVSEPFITRGSLHILANEFRIGWHPEYRCRLQHLIERVSV
jgi:hypothetical protein